MHNISEVLSAVCPVHSKYSITAGHSDDNLGTLSNPGLSGPTYHLLSKIPHSIDAFISTANHKVVLTPLVVAMGV